MEQDYFFEFDCQSILKEERFIVSRIVYLFLKACFNLQYSSQRLHDKFRYQFQCNQNQIESIITAIQHKTYGEIVHLSNDVRVYYYQNCLFVSKNKPLAQTVVLKENKWVIGYGYRFKIIKNNTTHLKQNDNIFNLPDPNVSVRFLEEQDVFVDDQSKKQIKLNRFLSKQGIHHFLRRHVMVFCYHDQIFWIPNQQENLSKIKRQKSLTHSNLFKEKETSCITNLYQIQFESLTAPVKHMIS
jgi:hypothetical protein